MTVHGTQNRFNFHKMHSASAYLPALFASQSQRTVMQHYIDLSMLIQYRFYILDTNSIRVR